MSSDLHCISGNPVVNTEVETGFTFRNETNPIVPLLGVRDELGLDGRPSHCNLFGASPAVWVTENENDIRFCRVPDRFPKCVGILDV